MTTSPGSTPALAAAPPGVTCATTAPVRDFRPKSSNPSRGTAVIETPMRPRTTLPMLQLRQQLAHRVDRDGEADADVPFGCAVGEDRRVHADHLAAQVQQRAAGVARVDRRVGLQHVVRCGRRSRGTARCVALMTPTVTV